MADVLRRRDLNRATLARQLLLERSTMAVFDAIEHLCGLQAQTTATWYTGLWTRLEDFDPRSVGELMTARRLVRVALLRSTVHLVTDRDCLAIRPLVQSVAERGFAANWGKHLKGLDLGEIAMAGRRLLEEQPMTFSGLGRRLQERWPDRDGASMAQAVRAYVALVQPPPRGLWGRSGQAVHATAEQWLGRPLAADPSIDDLLLRYLAAFGPAGVNDARTWSGLTGLTDVFERLRPRLRTFVDEQGRELFDLPEAPRPDPQTPAPVRFLYDYDNLLLSHADRSRVLDPQHQRLLWPPATSVVLGSVLLDGFVRASWRLERAKAGARLLVTTFAPVARKDADAVTAEGRRLLAFSAPRVEKHDVRVTHAE
jgi:hypothetical protein